VQLGFGRPAGSRSTKNRRDGGFQPWTRGPNLRSRSVASPATKKIRNANLLLSFNFCPACGNSMTTR
jgi:hypothetical protein